MGVKNGMNDNSIRLFENGVPVEFEFFVKITRFEFLFLKRKYYRSLWLILLAKIQMKIKCVRIVLKKFISKYPFH